MNSKPQQRNPMASGGIGGRHHPPPPPLPKLDFSSIGGTLPAVASASSLAPDVDDILKEMKSAGAVTPLTAIAATPRKENPSAGAVDHFNFHPVVHHPVVMKRLASNDLMKDLEFSSDSSGGSEDEEEERNGADVGSIRPEEEEMEDIRMASPVVLSPLPSSPIHPADSIRLPESLHSPIPDPVAPAEGPLPAAGRTSDDSDEEDSSSDSNDDDDESDDDDGSTSGSSSSGHHQRRNHHRSSKNNNKMATAVLSSPLLASSPSGSSAKPPVVVVGQQQQQTTPSWSLKSFLPIHPVSSIFEGGAAGSGPEEALLPVAIDADEEEEDEDDFLAFGDTPPRRSKMAEEPEELEEEEHPGVEDVVSKMAAIEPLLSEMSDTESAPIPPPIADPAAPNKKLGAAVVRSSRRPSSRSSSSSSASSSSSSSSTSSSNNNNNNNTNNTSKVNGNSNTIWSFQKKKNFSSFSNFPRWPPSCRFPSAADDTIGCRQWQRCAVETATRPSEKEIDRQRRLWRRRRRQNGGQKRRRRRRGTAPAAHFA